MSTTPIINGAPMTVSRGTQDKSTRQLVREPDAVPTLLAKVFLYAQKGPSTPQLVVGDSRALMYGSDSFDLRKKYANHATVLSNVINAEGSAQMIQRLIPADAGPEANLLLSIDVLPTTLVPVYQRNADGSLLLDANGAPQQQGTTNTTGYKVKFVVTNITTVANMNTQFGTATTAVGDQVQVTPAVTSQRYPLLQFKASSVGEIFNNSGIRIWSPTAKTSIGVDKRIINTSGAYPLRVSIIRRPDATSSASLVENNFGEQSIVTTLKPGVIDPTTDQELYIGKTFLDQYRNISDPSQPVNYGDFGTIFVYQSNIDTLLNMFYTAEKAYMDANVGPASITSDFTGAADEKYKFNMFGGCTSEGMPYSTFQFITAANAVRPSEYTNIYAAGSSDGTMSDALHAGLVTTAMADYIDVNSSVQDTAWNVESIMFDSGYPLATKYALCNFIGVRKDTFVVLSPYEAGTAPLTASQENSVAIALRTRLQNFPESAYFGTGVMRGLIMGRSGKLSNSQFTKDLPLTIELAMKAARYMGASDGKWKSGYGFDGTPGSIVENFTNINVTYTSATVRNKDWDAGLNWAQRYDRTSVFIPALKTVYTDDTSVLNSFFTAMIICELNKICQRAQRKFSGVSNLSHAQLAQRVDEFITETVSGKFDGRAIIEPTTYFTDADIARGYSWTTAVKVHAPNMSTVMTSIIQSYRLEDYTK